MEEGERPWLKPFVHTPAAKDPQPGATRERPLIYMQVLGSGSGGAPAVAGPSLRGCSCAAVGRQRLLLSLLASHPASPADWHRLPPLLPVPPPGRSYELPAIFNQVMLQYRPDRGTCVHRMYSVTNESMWVDGWLYGEQRCRPDQPLLAALAPPHVQSHG